MSPIHARIIAIALMVLWMAVVAPARGCKSKTNAFAPPPPPEVTVASPIQKQFTQYLEYTGTTEPYESIDLRARVAGFLDQVNFKPGSRVNKGDLLFVIDKRTYQAAVDRAQAQVASDDAAFKAAESDARIAEELFAQRAGSEIDKITKAGKRDSARAAIEASKAALASAHLDLEFCEVRAPIDGRITKNFVDVGNLVGPSAPGNAASAAYGGAAPVGGPTILATLVSTKPVYVSIDSSESDLLAVRRSRIAADPTLEPGQMAGGEWRPVDLALADETEFKIHGRIDYVDPALNPQTGTIRVRARFENEEEFLIPGLFVRVRILLGTQEALMAPDIALLSDQGGRYALVVNDKDTVELRRVKTGALDGQMRVVTEGLSGSDRMIVNGLQRARPGAMVKPIVQESKPGPSTAAPASTAASGH